MTRTTQRGRKVPRKPDGYAELNCSAALLRSLINKATYEGKPLSIRRLAALCGHDSHAHIARIVSGRIKTTSIKTATYMEMVLHEDGKLFTRHPARSLVQVRAERAAAVPAPRRAA